MMQLIRKMEVRPDGWLMLSILMFFTETAVFISIIGNVLIHEWGHIFMLQRYGVYIRRIFVSYTGLCIKCSLGGLTRRDTFLCAAAGPMAGLCAAVLCSVCGNFWGIDFMLLFAGTGAILSIFNLLPVKPLDGWRMLGAISPKAAERCGNCCSLILLFWGVYLMAVGYGTSLVCLSIFFLIQNHGERLSFG